MRKTWLALLVITLLSAVAALARAPARSPLSSREARLFLRHPRGEFGLTATTADTFTARFPVGALQYRCDEGHTCDSFSITDGHVRNLQFDRVNLEPVTSKH
jgi:hypothetical protein